MRSRNVSPGSAVTRITIRSESTRVPPVTELRSPPASRITGADSPVIADSSTDAIPSMISPSVGITSPVSQTTRSPLRMSGRRRWHLDARRRACARPSSCASRAVPLPGRGRAPRRSPPRSSRRAPSARARSRSAPRSRCPRPLRDVDDQLAGDEDGHDLDREHHGVPSSQRGSSLTNASISARRAIGPVNNDWDFIRRAFR